MSFTHLELHSHYTLLGATPSVAELVARGQADGLKHLALTDTNALYGAVSFDRACRAAGIRPIVGMTVTVAAPTGYPSGGVPSDQRPESGRSGESASAANDPGHLVLLARNLAGYRSLCRLSSLIQGSPEREALAARGLTWDELAAHREGLICLSGGWMGWIERFLRAGDVSAAQRYAGRLAGIFEEDACLALELHAPADETVAAEVAALGRRLGIPAVAVQPIYCLAPEDAPKLRLLAAIRENRRLHESVPEEEDEVEDEDEGEEHRRGEAFHPRLGTIHAAAPGAGRAVDAEPRGNAAAGVGRGEAFHPRLGTIHAAAPGERRAVDAEPRGNASPLPSDVHWLSPAEIAARFARFPGAVAQAGEVAARCGDALPDGRPIWPALKLPVGQTPDEALAALVSGDRSQGSGIRGQEPGVRGQEAVGRGQAAEIAQYASDPQIARNTQYEIRSTQHARLQHELAAIARHGYAPLFLVVADIVRFARSHDIPVSTRGSVANSLVAYCAGITTVDPIEHGLLFERFLSPARANPPDIDLDFCSRRRDEVLRYVRETYGAERVALVCTFSTLRPQSAVREAGKAYGLPEAEIGRLARLMPGRWHPDPRRRDKRTLEDVLPSITDPRHREVLIAAWGLIGQPDHLGVHPGALVITPGPLTDVTPVQWAAKGFLVTQFEHGDVEAIGLPKMDLLGIRALTVLADAAELVRRDHDPDFRLAVIPLDDPPTADLLARGDTIGVFQCESDGAQRTLRKLRARTVTDLAIANAFFKPGPAMGGMADTFVRRYRGQEAVSYLHPALKPILAATKGVLIFQEQVLRLATEIAGLDWAQADQIRRGMSHFGPQEMEAVAGQFMAGCQRPPPDGPGFTPAQARTLWEQIMPFAGYGFNQGHATAYADVSYRSAYLKTHYPAEYLCARLAGWGGFHHPVIYAAEAVRLGIPVRPPHVNFSGETFTLFSICDLRFTIAGSGQNEKPTDTTGNSNSKIKNQKSAVLYMGLGQVRDLRRSAAAAIVSERERRPYIDLQDLLARVDLQPKETDHLIRCGALDGLADSRAALLAEAELLGRKGAGAAAQLAFDFARPAPAAENPAQRLAWEQELLGWPVSVHPLALVTDRLPDHLPLSDLPHQPGRTVTTAGVRLPGWTGGEGFFCGDGRTFVVVKAGREAKAPRAWQPLLIRGRWAADAWGGAWFQAEEIKEFQV